MPTPPVLQVQPIFLSESDLIIDGDDYGMHISGAKIIPSTSTVSWRGSKRTSSFTRQTAPTWSLQLPHAQDWNSPKSLSRLLKENAGQTKEFTLRPVSGEIGWKMQVILGPGEIGGEVDQFGTTTVTLGLDGEPEEVPAVTPPTGG